MIPGRTDSRASRHGTHIWFSRNGEGRGPTTKGLDRAADYIHKLKTISHAERVAIIDRTSGSLTKEEGDELAAVRRLRSIRFGPTIHYVSAPDRDDLSWMEGDAVMINTAHPTYQKAASKKVVEYHDLIAVALAMLREVPTASEKLELLERFMSRWGKLV